MIFPTPDPKNFWILFNKAKSLMWSFIENWGVTFQPKFESVFVIEIWKLPSASTNPVTKWRFFSRLELRWDPLLTGGLPLNLVSIDNKRMASEVPTRELNALVTCGLFIFERIFTLEAHKMQLTHKVPNK